MAILSSAPASAASTPRAPAAEPAWSDAEKAALVQQIVSGGMSIAHACSEYGLTANQLKDWVCVFRRTVRQALDQQLRSTLSLQGLEVEELSRPEFSGNLSDLGVADLVQTIQHGRKDATITISHPGGPSYIWCHGGEIVDAQSGPSSGELAFYRILSLDQGSLVADFGATQRRRRITESTPHLLIEAASQRDRRTRALARIGDPGAVFVVESSVAVRHARDLGPDELAVLSSFDGARSLEQVVLASELSEPQALEIVIGFLEAGVLTQIDCPLTVPEAPSSSVAGAGMAMSYQPFAGTLKPAHGRPPTWVLVSGAVLCSSLGAVTAIAYADALEQRATAAARAATAGVSSAELPPPPASCPGNQVLIRGGRFFMGTDSSHPALQYARPAHAVSVDSFCLETREVSVAQYAECVDARACPPAHQTSDLQLDGAEDELSRKSRIWHNEQCNAGKPGRDQYPVNCVSHAQAVSYCAFRDSRLATEAEWEFAARGETNRLFPWGNAQPSADHVNACGRECSRWHDEVGLNLEMHGVMFDEDDGYSGTAPVGSFPLGATSDGVLDLIGNVFEWTADGLYAYDHSPRTNPKGPSNGDSFVIRGGNFNSGTAEFSDPALRFSLHADSYSHGVGLRCASDLDRVPRPSLGTTAQATELPER